MGSLWFTSDPHFGHAAIIRHCSRPFVDVEEMNETIIERHNAVVRDDDTVYHLGDFAWREQLVEPILKRLRGTHRLIAGNHDKPHPCRLKHEKATRRYLAYGFASVEVRATMDIGGVEVLLCHLPYRRDDSLDRRYNELRPVDRGGWLLHGHCHERWRVLSRQINVGVDVWDFAPVHADQIASVLHREAA